MQPRALDGIRLDTSGAPRDPASVDKAARELEGAFARMLIGSMRQSGLGQEDALFPGAAGHYRDLYDAQLAKALTDGRGLGLQAAIRRQLAGPAAATPAAGAATSPATALTKPAAPALAPLPARGAVAPALATPPAPPVMPAPAQSAPTPPSAANPALPTTPSMPPAVTLTPAAPASTAGTAPAAASGCGAGLPAAAPASTPAAAASARPATATAPAFSAAAVEARLAVLMARALGGDSGATDFTGLSALAPSGLPTLGPAGLSTLAPAGLSGLDPALAALDPALAVPPGAYELPGLAATARSRFAESRAPSSPEDFVARIWPHAEKAAAELGVPTKMLVAQAALETGWGRHLPRQADGRASANLFGIKAGGRWSGQAVTATTTEFVGGVARQEQARFRAYDSVADSFADYVALLKNNPRYADTVGERDGRAFARALQRAGYATDPDYAAKLTAIAEGPTLRRALDRLAGAPASPSLKA